MNRRYVFFLTLLGCGIATVAAGTVPKPTAWYDFEPDDAPGQLNDGLIQDRGPHSLDWTVRSYSGSPTGGQVFGWVGGGVTATPPKEHRVASKTPSLGRAYQMEGGRAYTYLDGPDADTTVDPRTVGEPGGDTATVYDLSLAVNSKFAYRDILGPIVDANLGGRLITYAFWMKLDWDDTPSIVIPDFRPFGEPGVTQPYRYWMENSDNSFFIGRGLGGGAAAGTVAVAPIPSERNNPPFDREQARFVIKVRSDPAIKYAENAPFKTNEWHHYVVSYDLRGNPSPGSPTGIAKIYQDGLLKDTFTGLGNSDISDFMILNQAGWAWGVRNGTESGIFSFDDLAIWKDVTLADSDVTAIYQQGLATAIGLSCDLNHDGGIDGADVGIMYSNWANSGIGDCDGDGLVDGKDLGILFSNWTGDSQSASVPEGSSLLAIGLLGVCLSPWRRAARRS